MNNENVHKISVNENLIKKIKLLTKHANIVSLDNVFIERPPPNQKSNRHITHIHLVFLMMKQSDLR